MVMDIKKKRLFKLDGFIKLLKFISFGVGVFAIVGIVIYFLIGNKFVDEVKEKIEEIISVLFFVNYIIIMGK